MKKHKIEPMATIESVSAALQEAIEFEQMETREKNLVDEERTKKQFPWYEEAIKERAKEKEQRDKRKEEGSREETIERTLQGIQSEFEHIGKILERLSRQLEQKRADKKSKDEWVSDLKKIQEK